MTRVHAHCISFSLGPGGFFIMNQKCMKNGAGNGNDSAVLRPPPHHTVQRSTSQLIRPKVTPTQAKRKKAFSSGDKVPITNYSCFWGELTIVVFQPKNVHENHIFLPFRPIVPTLFLLSMINDQWSSDQVREAISKKENLVFNKHGFELALLEKFVDDWCKIVFRWSFNEQLINYLPKK